MILDLVIIGLAITLEPIPLTAFLLILMSKGGVRKGAAFIFGWLLSLAVVVAGTILVTGNKPPKPNTAPSLAALAVKITIGVALLVIAERQRKVPGSGLGLFIVKTVAERHNGTVSARSAPGEGAEFEMIIPIHQ